MGSPNKANDQETGKEEVNERETWGNAFEFLLALVGCSVGYGNVWRFPYLCYKNGGGAFLIPYFLSALIGGIPIFYLEVAVGQFMGKGGLQAWNIVPLFQGIGIASVLIVFLVNIYYNVILALSIYYLVASFTSELPWKHCGHSWNTPRCRDTFVNVTNGTLDRESVDPVAEFWENKVLGISDGLEQPGPIRWELALCLFASWTIVYCCIYKGIRSSGKVMYVTATSPFIFMIILLIRNCTLEGSSEGIKYYLEPHVSKLAETTVWSDAGTQIFYSWSLGYGTLVAAGSYNKFHHNSYRDAAAFSVVNMFSSFLAGFIVFAILGFMAQEQGVSVADVSESGPGLAFIAYPKAVAQLPLSPLWSILFFVMLILLGLDTQFVATEAVVTTAVDQYPTYFREGYRKQILIAGVCLVSFLLGLSMVTEGGIYVLQLLDYYCGGRSSLLVVLMEVIAICFFYGVDRFADNVCMMVGYKKMRRFIPYTKVCWLVLAPVFCVVMIALSFADSTDGLTYDRPNRTSYEYPAWSIGLGWCLVFFAVVWVPIVAVYRVAKLVWMGGSLRNGDFRLLTVPYSLSDHQKRPQDKHERCLADFEENKMNEEMRRILLS